jgi:hypothetical protein
LITGAARGGGVRRKQVKWLKQLPTESSAWREKRLAVLGLRSKSSGGERLMREQIQSRLQGLRKEFETGQAELEKAEKQLAYLRETLLRISGAVQVLEELLAEEHSVEQSNGTDPANRGSVAVKPPSVGLGTGDEQPT